MYRKRRRETSVEEPRKRRRRRKLCCIIGLQVSQSDAAGPRPILLGLSLLVITRAAFVRGAVRERLAVITEKIMKARRR